MSLGIFNPRDAACRPQRGGVPAGGPADFFIRPGRGLDVRGARLLIRADCAAPQAVEMEYRGFSGLQEVYHASFTPPEPGLYWYSFELSTPQGLRYLSRGAASEAELVAAPGAEWQVTAFRPGFETPAWLKGGVIYQIFPDRFRREGAFPAQLPAGRVLRDDWGGQPEYRPDAEGKIRNNDYFGGSLHGITEKLGYLKSLGVTAVYLNPVFEAHSNHRYNTADYRKIDPLLGTEEDFRALCDGAERQGIRLILDGVFNHTGDDSVYFNRAHRYPGKGAYESRDSAYFRWYRFSEWPEKYDCWWGFTSLPAVNEDEPGFADFITGEGGVLQHWLEAGAGGFRLDVADELPSPFLASIRGAIKRVKPDALLIGEVWEDASNKCSYGERRHYLEGSELDSVMNYPFRSAILGFLRDGEAGPLNETVLTVLEHYPAQSVQTLMNVLGTHDTERLLTALAGEPAAGRGREWKAGQELSPEARATGIGLVRLAATIQFFLPGVPCVYYGDEAGMEGYDDPFNRGCYPWGGEDAALLEWYRTLGKIRAACPALRAGGYQPVAAEGPLYAFLRRGEGTALFCAVNAGDTPRAVALPKLPESVLHMAASFPQSEPPAPGAEETVVPPRGCVIFTAGEGA